MTSTEILERSLGSHVVSSRAKVSASPADRAKHSKAVGVSLNDIG